MSDHSPHNPPISQVAVMMQDAQRAFLTSGGAYRNALNQMRTSGQLASEYVFYEYPKEIRIRRGTETVKRSTVSVDKEKIEWDEIREIVDVFIVNSEEEEDRVLSGGKTADEIEQDRQALIAQAKARNLRFDPTWTTLRLQREMGIPVAAEQPAAFDEVAELEAQVAKARRAIALRKELDELNAQLAEPAPTAAISDDMDSLRTELTALGVRVDGRWSEARLRQELERATAPEDVTHGQ